MIDPRIDTYMREAGLLPILGSFAIEGPLVEEVIFRLFPQIAFGSTWAVGIPATLAFGFAHNFHLEERPDGEPIHRFSTTIPIIQLASGAHFWDVSARRGFSHALAAHIVSNLWPLTLRWVFREHGTNATKK